MAFSPNFEAGNRAEDPRHGFARAPLPTESRHAAGPFCVRTAGTASREPVARRDRIVVSTLRCGRSNTVRIRVTAANCDVDVLLLFATSPFSWVLRLHLGGILCCPPPAKRAGGPLPGVVVAERLRRWT
ncbi:hypothetical protein QQF64_016475 [Cirrhinus molitorella]|uniref:Uncharacterized protein n=1 Tax=Cirrhinus molitorella TaxID=172907 RepID=A0ABR3LQG2_9TELE